MPDLKYEKRGDGVAWVTISRPEAMNALNRAVLEGLEQAVATAAGDREVRALVVTGDGDKAFSAGADLKERRAMTPEDTRARIELINHAFNALARLPRLTIAAINGVAFGGGLELALACDLRVAVEGAKLGLTEVRLGIMPGAGGTQRLTRAVGPSRAKELILLGRRIDVRRAFEIGLLNEVAPAGQLAESIARLTDELAGCAPIGVAQAKEAIDRGLDAGLQAGLAIERGCYEVTLGTEDRNEGLAAFAEKRAPRYQGR